MEGHVRKRHRPTCAKRVDRRKRCNCDGRWQARIPDPARPGTTHKIERQFASEREAKAWLVSQQAAEQVGGWIDPRAAERPFAEVLTAWQQGWTGRLSPNTARRYRSIIDTYLTPEFGTATVGAITHERVQRYINRLNEQGTSPGTVRNVYAVLRTAFAKAVKLGAVKVNPCTDIDLPRANREPMLFLTAEQVRAVAEKIDAHYRVLVYVAAYAGLRAGELAGLQRQDVDLLRNVLHVRRAMKDVNGKLELGPTKTHAQRTVSLPTFLRNMLNEHLLASDGGPESFVFTLKSGGPLRHGLVYGRYFKRAVAGWTDKRGKQYPGSLPAELHALRFHDLRHTCAALSIEAGAHPKLIQQQLGHSSITVTLDRYGHCFPSMATALADALDATFSAGDAATSNVTALAR